MKHLTLDQVLYSIYKWSNDMMEKEKTQLPSETAKELEKVFVAMAEENEQELKNVTALFGQGGLTL